MASSRLSPGSSLLTMVLAASIACSEFAGPTSPSPLSTRSAVSTDGDFAEGAAQSALVVNWACLSIGIGCPIRAATLERSVSEAIASVPLNLAFSLVTTTVTLTWNVAQVGDPPSSFVIEAGSAPGATNLAVFDTGNTALSVTVQNVPAGTYYVRVRARNASGVSGPSNEVVIIVGHGPLPPCTPPTAPTGLTASVSGTSFLLQWTGIAGALGYVIEAGSSSGAINLAVLDTGTGATSYGGTAPAGTYYGRVRARTVCGTGAVSNEVVFTISAPLPGPGEGLTGQWLGLSPDGIAVAGGECPIQLDLQLDLVQSGSTLSGTAIGRVRQTPGGDCEELGVVRSFSILRGTSSGTAVAFSIEAGGDDPFRLDFTGTVSGTRMGGTTLLLNPGEPSISGTWAVVRQ